MSSAPAPPDLPPTHIDNGLLARVPSIFVAQVLMTLPDPATAPDEVMHAEVDTGPRWVGCVRLTFKKCRYSRPRGKSSYTVWHCLHAEPIA